MYFVNVEIIIREFKIVIKDFKTEETIRNIVKSQLIFYKNHNLIMYFKKILITQVFKESNNEEKESDFESSNSLINLLKNDKFFIRK